MDNIQKQLAQFQQQLRGGAGLYGRITETTPLLPPALAMMAGIVFSEFTYIPAGVCAAPGIAAALVGVAAVVVSKSPQSRYLAVWAAVIAFFCLGLVRLDYQYRQTGSELREIVENGTVLATIRGVIETEPYTVDNSSWQFGRFRFGRPSTGFYLRLKQIEAVDGWAQAEALVSVWVNDSVTDLQRGDEIQAYCRLAKIAPATNPGQFDRARHLARSGIAVVANVPSRDSISLLRTNGRGRLARLANSLRTGAALRLLDERTDDHQQGLLAALLLGDRGKISADTYNAFEKTGLLHIISLSGLHLGIVAAMVWTLGRLLGLLKPTRALLCVLATIVFLIIVPPRAPTLRASIIVFTFCAAMIFRRRPHPINTLSLAAIILLMLRPGDIFSAGWQLSFACVTAITLFSSDIHHFLFTRLTGLAAYTSTMPWLAKAVLSYAASMFSIGLAASVAGAPITAFHFNTVNFATAFWTVLAFPLVAVLLTVGYLKIILSIFWPSLAIFLGYAVNAAATALQYLVEFAANAAPGQIIVAALPLWVVLGCVGLILFVKFVYFRQPYVKGACCFAVVIVIAGHVGVGRFATDSQLRLHCLDVGHGQAIVVEMPAGTRLLFDAGSLHKNDVGRRIVVPFLRHRGIGRLEAAVLSHDDIDHINALPEIAQSTALNAVYASDAFLNQIGNTATAAFLARCLARQRLEIESLDTMETAIYAGRCAALEIVWPDAQAVMDPSLSENDKSVVTLLEYAGTSILLCSDIDRYAQRRLMEILPDKRIDIMVLPHHGSTATLEEAFVNHFDPEILISSGSRASVEAGRMYLPGQHQRHYHTAVHGAITVTVDSAGQTSVTTFIKKGQPAQLP